MTDELSNNSTDADRRDDPLTEQREVNIPLLRKAVEWVEYQAALPESQCEWYQGAWIMRQNGWYNEATQQWENAECGTAYCVAGYVAQLVDERFKDSQWITESDGTKAHSSRVAAEALGLPEGRSYDVPQLFAATNTAEDVRRIAEEIAGERL